MAKGTIVIRLPADLHNLVAQHAVDEGVSMNQWIVAVLAGATNYRKTNR